MVFLWFSYDNPIINHGNCAFMTCGNLQAWAQSLKVHRNRGRQFGSFGAPSHLAFETEALGFSGQGMDKMYVFPAKIGKLDKVAPNPPNTRGGTWLIKWLNDQFPSLVAIIYIQWIGAIMLDETINCVQRDAIHWVLDSKNEVKPDICPIFHLGFIGFNGV